MPLERVVVPRGDRGGPVSYRVAPPRRVTTDVDQLFQHYARLAGPLSAAGAAPTTTLLGVSRLALPDLTVEPVGTAVA